MSTSSAPAPAGRPYKDILYNVAGQLVPLVAALVTVPRLMSSLGADRFGLFTLSLSIAGYFSIFDFGLGRVLTKSVAEKRALAAEGDIPRIVSSALLMMAFLGVAGMLILYLIAFNLEFECN